MIYNTPSTPKTLLKIGYSITLKYLYNMIKIAAQQITDLINEDNQDDMSVIEPKALTILAMCGVFIHDTEGFFDAINRGGLTPEITETIIEQFK